MIELSSQITHVCPPVHYIKKLKGTLLHNYMHYIMTQLENNVHFQDKMTKPRYQDTPPEKIPVVYTSDKKVKVKIIAGQSLGKGYLYWFLSILWYLI